MSFVLFDDMSSLQDFATLVGRAKTIDPEGAVRLRGRGQTLATWVCVLEGSGLTGDGTVLGLRVLSLTAPSDVDSVVSLSACADRLARAGAEPSFSVPPVTLTPPWAALTPPRTGWEALGELPGEALRTVATDGIAEVATGAGQGAGALAVAELRRRVWTADAGLGLDVPRGAAFGLHALGFLPAVVDTVTAHRNGRWLRLSTPYGHVLSR